MIDSATFPMTSDQERRAVNPGSVSVRFAGKWPNDFLSACIARLKSDPGYEDISDRRNRLSHRLVPPSVVHVIAGDPTLPPIPHGWPVDWDDLRLEPSLTQTRLAWLESSLKQLWTDGYTFMQARSADGSWPR